MSKLIGNVIENKLMSNDVAGPLVHLAAVMLVFPLVMGGFAVLQSGAA